MQKDLTPLQQQQLQQQQRMAALYALQQQQQQQQQNNRPPHLLYGQPTGAVYSSPATMLPSDPSRLNSSYRPPQLQQQMQQGAYIRAPGMVQDSMNGDPTGFSPNGQVPKFVSPLQQQQISLQQQQHMHLQQLQLQQQQQQQPMPTLPQLPVRPALIPTATTPNVSIRSIPPTASNSASPVSNSGSALLSDVSANALKIEPTMAETPVQKENLIQYQQRDQAYQNILNVQHKGHILLAQEKKREIEISQHERRIRLQGVQGVVATFGYGYRGLGNGTTGMQSRLVYLQDKKRIRRTPRLKFSLQDMKEQSDKDDDLVPIRLDFEADGYKLRDTFTWNLNEQLVTAEQFAEQMCEDLRLPAVVFVPLISRSIRDQVQDYYLHAASMVVNETCDPESKSTFSLQVSDQAANTNHGVTKQQKQHAELRMLIKLDITVGHKALVDQFEWDINCPVNSPEKFAEVMSSDLGLGGEFRTAIAHSIREQVHVYTKSLLLVGHEFDGPVVDETLKNSFLPLLTGALRNNDTVEQFTPAIMELSQTELQKNEKDRLREARRKRRQTRGRRGIILPDREPLKTNRTSHHTQPEQEMTDEQFFASVNNGNTPTMDTMHSQRKSAQRARANIAAEAAGYLSGNQTPPHSSSSSSGYPTPSF